MNMSPPTSGLKSKENKKKRNSSKQAEVSPRYPALKPRKLYSSLSPL
jgi:hypothetical protein